MTVSFYNIHSLVGKSCMETTTKIHKSVMYKSCSLIRDRGERMATFLVLIHWPKLERWANGRIMVLDMCKTEGTT